MRRLAPILALSLALVPPGIAAAQDLRPEVADLAPRDGWVVAPTEMSFDELVAAVEGAAREAGLAVVTQAGPTGAAASRGIEIPGNRVLGLFNNDFAVRILQLSTAAMIEAPIRVYVTENADGTATFGYIPPSQVLAPYAEEAGPGLAQIGNELDAAFAEVARIATGG